MEEKETQETEHHEEEEKKILYCGICGLPPEYCEFGSSYEKCKPWILQHCTTVYPKLVEEILQKDKEKGLVSGEQPANSTDKEPASKTPSDKPEEVKAPSGGKSKKKEAPAPKIHVCRSQRSKKKSVTVVQGLDKFGIKLDVAAKHFRQKFSCGASVVKGVIETEEEIDVQGDFVDEIVDLIKQQWQIEDDSIIVDEPKKKAKK